MRRAILTAVAVVLALPLFATEPNPSARQRELVADLLELTQASNSGAAMMDAVFQQIEKHFLDTAAANGNRPQDIEEAKELFAAFRERAAKIDIHGLMQETSVRIYAKYFTEKDLEALLAFYSTPVGRKSIEVMPDLMRDSMEAGMREVSPRIDEAMNEVLQEQEKKRPWRRTMSDIRRVATALEAYALDHDERYPLGDYASLQATLEPYLKHFPEKDIWGHAYAYVVSPDQMHYRLVSAGADSIFDWDSRRIPPSRNDEEAPEIRYEERLENDIVYSDFGFVQLPVQAKPETEH